MAANWSAKNLRYWYKKRLITLKITIQSNVSMYLSKQHTKHIENSRWGKEAYLHKTKMAAIHDSQILGIVVIIYMLSP